MDSVAELILDERKREEMADFNHRLGKRHFGADQAGELLSELFLTPMDERTRMSVVLPVYNEAHESARRAAFALRTARRQGPLDKSLYEVVLVDNNSTDDTVKIARRFAAEHPDLALHIVPEPEQGVACARRTGHGLRVAAQRPARTLRRRAAVLPRLGRRRLPRGRALAVGAAHRDGVGQGRHRRLRLLLRRPSTSPAVRGCGTPSSGRCAAAR